MFSEILFFFPLQAETVSTSAIATKEYNAVCCCDGVITTIFFVFQHELTLQGQLEFFRCMIFGFDVHFWKVLDRKVPSRRVIWRG